MADEGNGGAGEGEPTGDPAPAPPKAKAGGGSTGESALSEKVDQLHKELSDERKKVRALTTERDQFKGRTSELEVKDTKRSALDAALLTVGDDFEINAERRQALMDNIEALAPSENISDRVLSLVNLAKQPKSAERLETPFGARPAAGGGSSDTTEVPEKKPDDYNTHELMALARTDPDRYKEVRAARDKSIGFGRK